MKARYKTKWLKALRSGEYAQGRGVLCAANDDREHDFCCLGVLINEVEGFNRVPTKAYPSADLDNNISSLSYRFREKVGITNKQQADLMALNDGRLFSFEQIADWIEKNIE